jgi:hypothetical protein
MDLVHLSGGLLVNKEQKSFVYSGFAISRDGQLQQ